MLRGIFSKGHIMTSYHQEYDGYYSMRWHDDEQNALKRWFDNFKLDKNATFATEYECLLVVEVPASSRNIKKRQVCRIEDEGRATSREVQMDHTAPPAPMLTFAAKRIWQPPPPKSVADLRREAEYERMYRLGYEPRRRMVPIRSLGLSVYDNPYQGLQPTFRYREEIEWVPRRRAAYDMLDALSLLRMSPPSPPRAPTHRRNV